MARPYKDRQDFRLEITALSRVRHVVLTAEREDVFWRREIADALSDIVGKLMKSDEAHTEATATPSAMRRNVARKARASG